MAGFMDFFSQATGAGASGLNDLLSEEQRRAINQQSMMAMAAQLLQAGGPSDKRTSLGQALGQGFTAAQQAQQTGQSNALTQMMTKQKIDEYKKSQAGRDVLNNMLLGDGATNMNAAQSALAAPNAGPAGPTMQRAQMMNSQPQQGGPLSFLSREQRAILATLPATEQAQQLMSLMSGAQEYGSPVNMTIDGKPTVVQFNKQGQRRVVDRASPYNALPESIQAIEYLDGQPLAGTGQTGMKKVGDYRSQIAPRNTSIVNVPGVNDFIKGAGGLGTDILREDLTAARSANETLRNIDMIAPALDKAILGPGADYRTVMTRVGVALGVGGKDDQERLNNTRQVVQALAKSEIDAAAGMKGQGPLTDSERAIIRRMSIGEQNMTPDELRVGMAAIQKNALYRQQSFDTTLQRAGTIPGFSGVAPMFQVDMYKPRTQLGGMLNIGDALSAEIQKRPGLGGPR